MRAGLTGLGLVFVATLAASVLFAPTEDVAPKEPSEPLAQLGVAPGPDKNGAAALAARNPPPPAHSLPMEPLVPVPEPDLGTGETIPLPQSGPPTAGASLPTLPRDDDRPLV